MQRNRSAERFYEVRKQRIGQTYGLAVEYPEAGYYHPSSLNEEFSYFASGGTATPTLYHGGMTRDLRAVVKELVETDHLPSIFLMGQAVEKVIEISLLEVCIKLTVSADY